MADRGGADRAKVAVLISGRGSNMAALLYASRAEDCPYQVVLVAADSPDAPGLALAGAEGIAVLPMQPPAKGEKQAFFSALDKRLRESGAEWIALAGFMRILPADFIAGWDGRILNIHPSLLPLYKGLHTHERALEAGDAAAGCSVHVVTPALDDGPVLGQTRVAILPGDTAETLAARVLIAEHQLYPRVLADAVRGAAPAADTTLDRLRDICLALPGAAEKLSHGMPAFQVEKGRMFAYFWSDHHGDGETGVVVKASGTDEQAMLIEMDADRYWKPPYLGPSGWIGIRLGTGVDWDMVGDRIAASWELAAPRALLEADGR